MELHECMAPRVQDDAVFHWQDITAGGKGNLICEWLSENQCNVMFFVVPFQPIRDFVCYTCKPWHAPDGKRSISPYRIMSRMNSSALRRFLTRKSFQKNEARDGPI